MPKSALAKKGQRKSAFDKFKIRQDKEVGGGQVPKSTQKYPLFQVPFAKIYFVKVLLGTSDETSLDRF